MSDTRKPYPTDVGDEEWAFVTPYLTLLPLFTSCREDPETVSADTEGVEIPLAEERPTSWWRGLFGE